VLVGVLVWQSIDRQVMTCAPRDLASPVWRIQIGLSNARSGNVDQMVVSLDIYGRADASSALWTQWLDRPRVAAGKRRDKQ
jgi:hypothetical protein